MQAHDPKKLKGVGIAFLSVGLAFSAVTLTTGQIPFIGVSTAFVTLGIVFLAQSRKAG